VNGTQRATCYIVASPEYDYVDEILCGQGPVTHERDVLYVWARNANRAKAAFLRAMRRRYRHRSVIRPAYLDDNPFAGMLVERLAAETGRNA